MGRRECALRPGKDCSVLGTTPAPSAPHPNHGRTPDFVSRGEGVTTGEQRRGGLGHFSCGQHHLGTKLETLTQRAWWGQRALPDGQWRPLQATLFSPLLPHPPTPPPPLGSGPHPLSDCKAFPSLISPRIRLTTTGFPPAPLLENLQGRSAAFGGESKALAASTPCPANVASHGRARDVPARSSWVPSSAFFLISLPPLHLLNLAPLLLQGQADSMKFSHKTLPDLSSPQPSPHGLI